MNKYVIEETTLSDIANSIRTAEESTEEIKTNEYADRIKQLEKMSTLEYMQIEDMVDGNFLEYSDEEIEKVAEYIEKFGGEE